MTLPARPSIDVTVSDGPVTSSAPTERGWGKLLLAIAAFLFIPVIAWHVKAFLPIDQTMILFVPAVAACALVGWWAGGRAYLAVAWVALAALMTVQGAPQTPFFNLVRGWSLLLAGSFGLVCLFSVRAPLFSRSVLALGITMALAMTMSLVGPVSLSQASKTIADEFARRNTETMATVNSEIQAHPKKWAELTAQLPWIADGPAETQKELRALSGWGLAVFPALLALQSLAALSLAWATYHRLGRARLGAPLRPLRDFRFNDQLVWGLIVGLTILLVPTLSSMRGVGKNLLVFFGALYALRGFGVLTWFMRPRTLGLTLGIGFVMLNLPFLNGIALLAFIMAGVASLALGLGDTWADWRNRARSTP